MGGTTLYYSPISLSGYQGKEKRGKGEKNVSDSGLRLNAISFPLSSVMGGVGRGRKKKGKKKEGKKRDALYIKKRCFSCPPTGTQWPLIREKKEKRKKGRRGMNVTRASLGERTNPFASALSGTQRQGKGKKKKEKGRGGGEEKSGIRALLV